MSMWSCYYYNFCVLWFTNSFRYLRPFIVSFLLISLEPPQIIRVPLFENPGISFFASFVTFCHLDPGIIVPVTSYSGHKYFSSLLKQPRIWQTPISKILVCILIGQLMALLCFENIFFLMWWFCMLLGNSVILEVTECIKAICNWYYRYRQLFY